MPESTSQHLTHEEKDDRKFLIKLPPPDTRYGPNVFPVTVTMSFLEVNQAKFHAGVVMQGSEVRGCVHKYGANQEEMNDPDKQTLAYLAEMAMAKATNRYWEPKEGNFKRTGDVGGEEVRHTERRDNKLIIRPNDIMNRRFWLVTEGPIVFTVWGWFPGHLAKECFALSTPNERPKAHWVPRCFLYKSNPCNHNHRLVLD